MTPSDIESLASVLTTYGITLCDIHDAQRGLAVSMRLYAGAQTQPPKSAAQAASAAEAAKSGSSNVLRSPGMGRFAANHPLQDGSAASQGQRVEAGQVVGYLLAGALVSEITASQTAVLGRRLAEEGQLVGYGDAVFEIS